MFEKRLAHVVEVAAAGSSGQDRARVFENDAGVVIALADGAGGTGGGALAAEAIVDAVGAAPHDTDWCALLDELDQAPERLGHGTSTAVILSVSSGRILGASVGDSGAWLVAPAGIVDVTAGQTRKPLVGDGCRPFRIAAAPLGAATLLVASDGLFRYAQPRDIARIVHGQELSIAARALIDLVRLPRGGLQDDVSVVLCRPDTRVSP